MYANTLNCIFNIFAKWERANATCAVNKYISPKGVQKHLQDRLKHNELFRHQIFAGRFTEEITNDKLQAAQERIEGNYRAGLIDAGKYHTQLYKINALRNMRFAEQFHKWNTDKQNLKHYKLKYAAQLGEDVERIAFNYSQNEDIKKHGYLYGAFHKRGHRYFPDKPQI